MGSSGKISFVSLVKHSFLANFINLLKVQYYRISLIIAWNWMTFGFGMSPDHFVGLSMERFWPLPKVPNIINLKPIDRFENMHTLVNCGSIQIIIIHHEMFNIRLSANSCHFAHRWWWCEDTGSITTKRLFYIGILEMRTMEYTPKSTQKTSTQLTSHRMCCQE